MLLNRSQRDYLKKKWPFLMILGLLVILTYINALNNDFLSDDLSEIVHNPQVGNLGIIATRPFGFIRLLLNFFAFHIGGMNPLFFRLINYAFHLGIVYLIFILFDLFYSTRIAFFTSALFAVHPAITEAIVWISGGTYPQYSFFFLLSFLLYLLSKQNKKFYLFSVATFILSFMSHPQMPMALFLIFPLWEICFGNLKKNWPKTLPFVFITGAFLLITLGSLPERETTLKSIHYQEGGVDNPIMVIIIAVSSYLQLIFFPKTLTLYHSELSFNQTEFYTRSLLTLLMILVTLMSFKKNKFLFFWLAFFFIALSPTLTPFRLNWVVAERYLYLPSLGIFAVIAYTLDQLAQKKSLKVPIYVLFASILILLSIRTIIRNIDWKNEDNLWIATGKTSPSSPNAHNNLGDVYGRHGDKQAALREFQKAIEIKPNYGDAYHNLANTYRELGQIDKALENYQKALEFNPNLWQSYQNIAAIYFQAKQFTQALDNIQKAITINPGSLNLRDNLGIIYLAMGNKEQAKETFNLVLSANPQDQLAKAGLTEASK